MWLINSFMKITDLGESCEVDIILRSDFKPGRKSPGYSAFVVKPLLPANW